MLKDCNMILSKCRTCNSKKFSFLFSLGNLSFTGKFSKNINNKVPKGLINLVMCKKCKLVQLDRNFNPKYLYSSDYGYRTGINKTMTNHVHDITKQSIKLVNLDRNDYVLDIASNDGTLLNFYNDRCKTVGIDPLVNKYLAYYKNINHKISDFFSYKILKKKNLNKKFKIITALSMFYDLRDPNNFLSDIKKLLHDEGVFVLEHADLLSIFKYFLFDTICHEHLEYYSSKIILNLMENNGLRVFNIKTNNINGGSTCYFICHKYSKFKINKKKISKILREEKKFGLENINSYKKFLFKIDTLSSKIKILIDKILSKNLKIHGYGASTKGNVLLQYLNITSNKIQYIAERNPLKYNKFTPGTSIKIISEKYSRSLKPDYYLVLPWHFKDEILIREQKIINSGTKFIFPLPKLRIF